MRWYVAAVLLVVLTFVFRMGLLAYAIYVLVGTLLLSRFLARSWIENIQVEREFNRLHAEIGEIVVVITRVTNTGKVPIAWLLMEDVLPRSALVQRPPRLKVLGDRRRIAELMPGKTEILAYRLQFEMRGYYQIGPLMIETGDLFGLHRRYRTATQPGFVLVYPNVIPLEGYDIASRRPIGEIRMTHRLFEDPTRMAGVRLYQQGDPLSRVHWRATARTGTLHSKIHEPSTIAGATILLDFHQDSFSSRNEPIRSELAITTAASLANAVYQLGQQIGLITNGRDAADRIRTEGWTHEYRTRADARAKAGMEEESNRLRPVIVETRRGVEQLRRILETLARVEKTDGLSIAGIMGEISARAPRDSSLIAVLGDVSEETAAALGSLKRRGYAVVAVVVAFDDAEAGPAIGRLLAERIDVRRVLDEASLSSLCSGRLASAWG